MKYVLKTTAFRPDTGTVEEYYVRNIDGFSCIKLSDACVWDSFDEVADLLEEDDTWDAKIVAVSEKELFEARLKDE